MTNLPTIKTGNYGFQFDRSKLERLVVTAYCAVRQGVGIFENDCKLFLPQYNLPPDLEYNPRRDQQVKDPLLAAQFLWTEAFFERRTESRGIIEKALSLWQDTEKRWFFDPKKTAQKDNEEVQGVVEGHFGFSLDLSRVGYKNNAVKLVELYDGDPRKIIAGKSVDAARRALTEFSGIGRGIANLYMMYVDERCIVSPTNADELTLKVDVHKGRLPINCGAIIPLGEEIVYDEAYTQFLEREYRDICDQYSLDPKRVDLALWVIGSEICARQNIMACTAHCPLHADQCEQLPHLNGISGRYEVRVNGKKVDKRQRNGQGHLSIGPTIDESVVGTLFQ